MGGLGLSNCSSILYDTSMHILFIHNPTSGKGIKKKKLDYILKALKEIDSDFEFIVSQSKEDFISLVKTSCGKYDYLIISGGDGSVNMTVNAIAEEAQAPVLGFIPTGTCNDACKNYGIDSNVKHCIEIIKRGNVEGFDILKCNHHYCVFAMAIGGVAAIPYQTTKKGKRKLGVLAYYLRGIGKMFKPSRVHGTAIFKDGKIVVFDVPFVIVLNTSHIGGYNVNPSSKVQDGKFDLFLSPIRRQVPALFSFLFHSHKIPHYQVSEVLIESDCQDEWDIDGEKGEKGTMKIEIIKKGIRVLSDPNRKHIG